MTQQKSTLIATLARLTGRAADDLQEMTENAIEAAINEVLEDMRS